MEEKAQVFDFQNEARECRKNYYFAIFNLMNAIVGAGMLSLSFAVKVRGSRSLFIARMYSSSHVGI